MNNQNLTLLSEGQIWGNSSENQLEVLRKYGTKAAISDLCVLTGSYLCEDTDYNVSDSRLNNLKGRTSWFWTRSDNNDNDVRAVSKSGDRFSFYRCTRNGAVRPALQSSAIYSQISPNKVRGYNDTYEVEYGEYPQYVVNTNLAKILETSFLNGNIKKTGKTYTTDSRKYDENCIQSVVVSKGLILNDYTINKECKNEEVNE